MDTSKKIKFISPKIIKYRRVSLEVRKFCFHFRAFPYAFENCIFCYPKTNSVAFTLKFKLFLEYVVSI